MKKFLTVTLFAVVGILGSFMSLSAKELTICDGTSGNTYVPFHFYYLDDTRCKTQVVYPASELTEMVGNQIREVEFYLNDDGYASAWATPEMILSLGEYSESTANVDTDGYGTFYTGNLSVAYSGPMEGEGGGRLLTFELSSPYQYNGGNLMLQISLGTKGNAYPRAESLGVSTDTYQAMYTTTGTVYGQKFLPKTKFTYGEQAQYEATVSTEEMSFPTTMLGQSSSATLSITNTGAQSLSVAMTKTGDAFTASLPSSELASGSSMQIPVTFTPTSAGEVEGEITLNLGEAGTFNVTLKGNGMEAPTGYTTNFNVPAKSLPEGWIGWLVVDTYDYSIYDYIFKEAKEDCSKFESFTLDGRQGISINFDNPWRDYPDNNYQYMISPAVEGNVMLELAKDNSGDSYGASTAKVYAATQGADGSWTLSENPLEFNWASEPGNGWGIMIGSVAEPTHLAILMSSMAIASFAADASASGDTGKDYAATVTPDALDFGQVVVGKSVAKDVTISNTGRKSIELSLSDLTDTQFSADIENTIIESGKSGIITVTFAPTASGDFAETLTISMGEAGSAEVSLSGKAVTAVVGAEFTVDGLTYTVTSQSEAGVSGVSSDVTECTVPATIINPDGIELAVTSIEREAFYWSNVEKVTLPEGITKIGYGAFRTSPLTEINLPSTVTEIGDFAFRSTKLTSVEIPAGVENIGSSVFASCEHLTNIKLPANLKSIGSGAFYKTALTSIEIPEGCVTIGDEAFEMCTSLAEVDLPKGLTEISSMLFLGCTSLTEIEIPETVTDIKTRAFEETGLIKLHLPASVSKIASNTFNSSPIATITVDETSTSFQVVEGILYDVPGDYLYLCPRSGIKDEITVADGCKGIIGGAFYGCPVKKVILPETMLGIDEYAFCTSTLEEINLPKNIFLISTQAFAGTNLTNVVLPEALEEVSDGVFASCKQLTSITLPVKVDLIGNRAFYNCTALQEIICESETPAEFDSWDGMTDPFYGVDCSKVTVYCPDGADVLADYKASEWADFFTNIKNISEREGAGLNDVDVESAEAVIYYNLQGVRVNKNTKGILIKVQGDKISKIIND